MTDTAAPTADTRERAGADEAGAGPLATGSFTDPISGRIL